MNSFQFYEPIGKGKHSTVYKGRKKKTIEYYAIKSVDASQKSKVLHEVRMLHMLDHPNVLKFYSWYETSAHLWLILEYCVGGDLLTLLKQDSKLPEESIHELGYDIVKALLYIHSKGVIYGDLKPSNILLDENGSTKLCDFGMARRLSDISRTPLSTLPQPKRGSPCYMAPELFEDGGVHSYASDFWALGCVLYECYSGRPPFAAKEFKQLVKSILSDPTPPLPGTPSPHFVSLVNSLLAKNPIERIKWVELCGHPFWNVKIPFCSLPPQPAFESMIELYTKQCTSDLNEDLSSRNKTPPRHRERDIKVGHKHDENASDGIKTREISSKGVKSAQPKNSGVSGWRVNLVRLSRIAKSNLQKENEKENYRGTTPNGGDNNAEVKLENNDMELDFDENEDAESQDEIETSSASIQEEKTETQGDQEIATATCTPDEHRLNGQTLPSRIADTPEIALAASPLLKAPRVNVVGPSEFDSVKSSSDVWQVIWHSSDLIVKPVMQAKKSEKVVEVIPALSFNAPQPPEFLKMTCEQRELLTNKIISVLHTNSNVTEKQHVIRYLELLSSNADAANVLTNGPIMLVLVKMLRQSKTSSLRVHLLSLVGLFIRNSTNIDQELANSGILNMLADGLRDPQEKIRRCSMVALGELLFYISTQMDNGRESNPPELHTKDGRSTSAWQVPNAVISLVSSVLRKGEDDLTQLYALRSIENICSRGSQWASRFSGNDVINHLCYIYRAAGKQESTRLTAGSSLVRIARFTSAINIIVDKLTIKEIASSLVKGTARERQINLNLLNMAIVGSQSSNIGRLLSSLGEDKNLVPNLISLIEQGSEVLRGKAFLLLGLLCKNSKRWLSLFFCNARLITAIDRLARENEPYLRRCLDAVTLIVSSIVPNLLDGIIGDVQQLSTTRRPISAIPGRAAGSKTNIHLFPVVLHLLGCSVLKRKIVGQRLLQQLAKLTKIVETHFQGRDDFQISLLRVMESVVEESTTILENPKTLTSEILPSLLTLYKGNKDGDARFLCLKIVFDVMVILLNQQVTEDLTPISHSHFLPLYPSMIEDEDPIPMYAQKLLVMLIDFNCIQISDIMQPNIISQCFHFLLEDLSKANLNNVKLCLALASAPEIDSPLLSHLKVVRQISNLLEFVYAKNMEDFLCPTLALCRAFLRRSIATHNSLRYAHEPSLLNHPSFEEDLFIRDIADFGGNVGLFLDLSACDDDNASDVASDCLVLLLKVAPREGIFGLLTRLAKVAIVLDRCARELVLLRVLHALAYSCRMYVSHALILSISSGDVSRVDVVLGKLKKSSLADVAKFAASELHRLPRGA